MYDLKTDKERFFPDFGVFESVIQIFHLLSEENNRPNMRKENRNCQNLFFHLYSQMESSDTLLPVTDGYTSIHMV